MIFYNFNFKLKHLNKGFTLIEMLIAIAIFAIISIISYSALNRLIEDVSFLQKRNEEASQIKLLNKVISTDLLYLVNRPVNTFNGIKNAFVINNLDSNNATSNNILLQFTRGGITKIGIKRETGLVRVAYILDNGDLKRAEYEQLDYIKEPENYTTIISNVKSFKTEVLTQTNIWNSIWQIPGLPKAIKITVVIQNENQYSEEDQSYEIIMPGLMNN